MIYVQGYYPDQNSWHITEDEGHYGALGKFKNRKEARTWIVRELKKMSKEINKTKDWWMRVKL